MSPHTAEIAPTTGTTPGERPERDDAGPTVRASSSPSRDTAAVARCAGPVLDTGAFEPVPHAIRRLAHAAPDRLAVFSGDRTLSYGQLLARAEAVAERILAEGVTPGSRVALCLERGVDMPAVLLAILLCGCSYIPLDPLFPLDRMEATLLDADSALLVTDGAAALPSGTPQLLTRDIGQEPRAPLPQIEIQGDDLAYIIYTSGSTGTPKGVTIQHSALRSLLCAMQHTPGFTAQDVLVAITTLTFDISVADMWLPLFSGATLVVATQEESRNPALLDRLLRRHRATMLQATPGLWRAMVEQGWTTHGAGAAPVRVLCGGESMSRDLADLLLARAPEVWNMYGPTECTVWVTATRVGAGTTPPGIEAVLPNSQMFVLDDALELVPAGVTGELVIGGGNVGAGYWNRPELTADRFVANPFGPGMLYRTGDLAELRPEGGLRLLGRSDFQVKVRGFRVELGEIEHVLTQHPSVREAVVVQQRVPATADGPASEFLVAFLEVDPELADEDYPGVARDLNASLRVAVPDYMIPAGIVPLAKLPRLFNNKIDRKALPQFQRTAAPSSLGDYVAPRDALERQLAQIWQSTLGIDRIGMDTSYFSLGADSLTALRLISRINRTFAMQLGLADLLTSGSIGAIAALIQKRHSPGVLRALVPLRRSGSQPPLFLLHGVGGNVLTFAGLAESLGEDQPVYALQAQALLTGKAALLRLEDLAAYYIAEMKTVQPRGPYRLLGYSFGGTVAAEMAHQLRAGGESVVLLAMLDARTREFEVAHRDSMGTHGALQHDYGRFTGNVNSLSWEAKRRYIAGKLATRGARYTALALAAIGFRRIPSCLKVAWDVNLIAFRRYRPKVNPGRLVLFRARHQDFTAGPQHLGWGPLFPEGIDIHEIDSDHERIFLEPAFQELSSRLAQVLKEISDAPGDAV